MTEATDRNSRGQLVKKSARSTRDNESRAPLQWRPPGMLDVPEPPEGMKWRWVRHEVRGNADNSNVYKRTRQGYEPVKPDQLGNFDTDSMVGGPHDGVVRSGDLILMQVPKEIAESRNDYFKDRTARLQQAVDAELNQNAAQTMDGKGIHRANTSSVTKNSPHNETEFED